VQTTRKINIFLFMFVLIVLCAPSVPKVAAVNETAIQVEPALNEFGNPNGDPIPIPGTQFNVTVGIYDVTNLYGFDLKFRWNTTYVRYVNRSVHAPRDVYPDGILWNPILQIEDEVNASEGTYWVAFASTAPASSFNGTGTVFTMTFEVIRQPYDYETGGPGVDSIDTALDFSSTDLAPRTSEGPIAPIAHSVRPATVRIWEKRSESPVYPILKVMPTIVENAPMNNTFNVNIWIIGVDPKYDIQGFNITLSFNSTLIQATGVTEGSWLKSYAQNTIETEKRVDNVSGTVTYALAQIPPTTHPPPTNSGVLFTISFYVIHESLEYPQPLCELTLEPTEILDRNIGLLTHTTENSTYTAFRPSPVAKFTWSPGGSILLRGQAVTFSASESYNPLGGKIAQYAWDFGDNATENTTDPVIAHTYTKTGDFTLTLTVTDYGGFWGYASTSLHVIEPPPKPHLAVDPPYLKFGPHPPRVVGQQFDVNIYVKSLDAAWSLQNAHFSLSYNTTLIDIIGDMANVTIPDLWRGPNNVALIRQPSGIADVAVTLNGPSVAPSGDQLAVTIEFTLMYQGTYPSVDASLITLGDIELTGAIGEIPTEPQVQGQIVIKGLSAPLQANFEFSPQNPKINESVTFDASSSNQNDYNITTYTWDFGDGNVTTVRVPVVTHHYSIDQAYNATLSVEEVSGLTDATWKTIAIEPAVLAPTEIVSYAVAVVAVIVMATVALYMMRIRKHKDQENQKREKQLETLWITTTHFLYIRLIFLIITHMSSASLNVAVIRPRKEK